MQQHESSGWLQSRESGRGGCYLLRCLWYLSINHQGKKHFVSLITKTSSYTEKRQLWKLPNFKKERKQPRGCIRESPKLVPPAQGRSPPTPHLRCPLQPRDFPPCLTPAAHSNTIKGVPARGDLTCEANRSSWEPRQILSIPIFNSPPNMVN